MAYCAHCDGPFFKDKDISVIGGGNSGVEAALDLAGIVKHVTVLEFADELKADLQVLINRVKEKDNIEFITSAATQEIKATDGKVTIVFEDRNTGDTHERDLSGCLFRLVLCQTRTLSKALSI